MKGRPYELQWNGDCPEAVLTHLLTLCDVLSTHIDQDKTNIGKLAYRIIHLYDVQNAVLSMAFSVNQQEANKMRRKMIGKKKL